MNEEKLEQILNRIGGTSVPPNIAGIAEQNQQTFVAALRLFEHKSLLWVRGFKMSVIAACILSAFVIGRWLRPAGTLSPSPDSASYTQAASLFSEIYDDGSDFWREKQLAATQPRPYVQSLFTESDLMNAYKQYLKE